MGNLLDVCRAAILVSALLTTTWPSGQVQHSACTDNASCYAAEQFDLKRAAARVELKYDITPAEAGFPPDWDCVEGYHGPRGTVYCR